MLHYKAPGHPLGATVRIFARRPCSVACVMTQNSPFFKAFWDFRRAKTGHHELKTCQKHLFWHSMWSRIIFEKSHFFAPGAPC